MPSLKKGVGCTVRGSVLFRKQGAHRFGSQNRYLVILPEHTLEIEHLGPGEVLGRAAACGLLCGSGGTLGEA